MHRKIKIFCHGFYIFQKQYIAYKIIKNNTNIFIFIFINRNKSFAWKMNFMT